ncbi:hypothetical protein [Nocardia jiangxiensis]|uniref:hypothetical protein n=1 Tax=Nocardia jiangxiensis TaxID=282685 RepID=UPI0002FF2EDE|nr:hypothetical protein [Nocardia jiangxiensis]
MSVGLENLILSLVAGGSLLQALVMAWANRKKTKADTASELARNALAQVSSVTARCDQLESDVREFKKALYPHQSWDLKAHKAALEVDPNFPAPPELFIG